MSSHPEHIEEIFKRVEEESERRAAEEQTEQTEQTSQQGRRSRPSSSGAPGGRRRGGSVSISRFGEPIEPTTESSSNSINSAVRLSRIASKSNVYQSRMHTANNSSDSFASMHDEGTHEDHDEDEEHVTQMRTITGRQTLTKSVGEMLARSMSRSRSNSRSIIAPSDTGTSAVVIGVSVQQATVPVAHDQEDEASSNSSTVYAQRNGPSPSNRDSWVAKVTQKFRRKSKSPVDGQAASA
ncbi:hypothetical protein NEOLEDRAFT_1182029 [Neolentinus lepideus HHB14362 ss-1]|uniref:Uncharacterized protein n=1 Tax=Neolentinus lepideus HHB14362 ss-1 TaxID=1314782 RepID=A0A165PJ32_9AGAM|nr:hypothetical protein NEOLEDRAFT_1182029 [Neolentinus lepideus HHB14362 ss-1]